MEKEQVFSNDEQIEWPEQIAGSAREIEDDDVPTVES